LVVEFFGDFLEAILVNGRITAVKEVKSFLVGHAVTVIAPVEDSLQLVDVVRLIG
jgi:hypothetical protein